MVCTPTQEAEMGDGSAHTGVGAYVLPYPFPPLSLGKTRGTMEGMGKEGEGDLWSHTADS